MVEDDDDKVRRNLVVMSTAILLVAFLDVPVQALLAKSVSSDWQPSLARGWLAACVVLFYMALRFRFHPASFDAFGEIRRAQRERVVSSVSMLASKIAIDSSAWWMNAGELSLQELERIRKNRQSMMRAKPGNLETLTMSDLNGNLERVDLDSWRAAHAVIAWTTKMQPAISTKVKVPVPWELRQAIPANLRAVYYSWLYSKEAIMLLAPIVLALLAALVGSFKAMSNWLAS